MAGGWALIAEAAIVARRIAGHPSDAIIAVPIVAQLLTLGKRVLAQRRILRIGRARRNGEEDHTKKGVSHGDDCPAHAHRESRRWAGLFRFGLLRGPFLGRSVAPCGDGVRGLARAAQSDVLVQERLEFRV